MNQIEQTENFALWLKGLKDFAAKAAILKRIKRLEQGLFGDHKHKSVGSGVFELRINIGKGWRVYYFRRSNIVYLLLHGGSKATQQTDINYAIELKNRLVKEQPNENP